MLPAAIGEVRERRGVVWDRRAPDPPSRRSLGFDKAGLAETPGQPGRVRLRFFRSGASILLRGSTLLTAAMKEMQDSETARLFSPIKQSLLATLKSLTPHLEKINEGWRAGFGLRAMRERIEGLGGRFYMESWPAKFGHKRRGTRIEIDLPVPTPEAI